MPKKKIGLLTALTVLAAGAAAVFFSKKENREKTIKVAKATAQKVTAKVKASPAVKKAAKRGKVLIVKAKKIEKKAVKTVAKIAAADTKKVIKKLKNVTK